MSLIRRMSRKAKHIVRCQGGRAECSTLNPTLVYSSFGVNKPRRANAKGSVYRGVKSDVS